MSRVRAAVKHYPYYVELLSRIPFGTYRRLTGSKCRGYSSMEPFLVDKRGLEIGGPSRFFHANRLVPVYDRCREIDNCNFSARTIWKNSSRKTSVATKFNREIVAEASDLSAIPDATYDFVIASHVLEHVANPLRALLEWRRVLRANGALLILVPDKQNTFDRKRPFTSFEHIQVDFAAGVGEDDLTHLDEVLALHDLRLDPWAGSPRQFQGRCLQNASVRAIHHHVFSEEVLALMLEHIGMRTLSIARERPIHIIAFAQKTDAAVDR